MVLNQDLVCCPSKLNNSIKSSSEFHMFFSYQHWRVVCQDIRRHRRSWCTAFAYPRILALLKSASHCWIETKVSKFWSFLTHCGDGVVLQKQDLMAAALLHDKAVRPLDLGVGQGRVRVEHPQASSHRHDGFQTKISTSFFNFMRSSSCWGVDCPVVLGLSSAWKHRSEGRRQGKGCSGAMQTVLLQHPDSAPSVPSLSRDLELRR